MKLRDVSLKNKVLISNLIMAIVPILVVTIVIVGFVNGVLFFLSSHKPEANSLGMLSVYLLQQRSNRLEKSILDQAKNLRDDNAGTLPEDGSIRETESGSHALISQQALADCHAIEDFRCLLAVTVNEEPVYLSTAMTLHDYRGMHEVITGTETFSMGESMISNESGTVICYTYPLENGNIVRQVLLVPQLNSVVHSASGAYSDTMLRSVDRLLVILVLFAFAVILLIDAIIVYAFSRAVLNPMQLLLKAMQEMKAGNLSYDIGYRSMNEMGLLVEGFEQLRQRLKDSEEEKQRYEKSRKDIIAGISHDLGTPLTSIKGYASGLLDGIATTPEKQERYLQTIYDTAVDMDKLVGEFSLFSKLDTDIMPFFFEKGDLTHFFNRMRFEMEETFAKNKVAFSFCNLHADKKLFIKMDQVQLKRVYGNLLDNCIKYRRGEIRDSRAILTLELINDDRNVQITIESNGNPVSEEDCAKIFDTFYRSSQARTDVLNGSGLGLSVCRMIVERHGGKIFARSSKLGGLAIVSEFPIVEIEDAT